jgi:enediyne biosynthesis thioesterase
VVDFSDTNLVGNVYYVNYVKWQGRCRELVLRDHTPEVVKEIENGLALVTVRVACEFLDELTVFDEVVVRMSLMSHTQNRATMRFEYWRQNGDREALVARGEQQVASMRREGDHMKPAPWPRALQAVFDAML